MPAIAQRLPFGRKTAIALVTLGAVALLCLLFDWNWFRPLVERYLSEKSRREVRAGHMSVSDLLTLEPTVTFRDAYIGNAPWADTKQPMAVAGEAAFTFSIRSVIDERTVISKIVLKDADIDMQKQADGLRNWRLKDPDYRGPPRIKVLRLEAYRSKLRFADRDPERSFDIRFAASEPGGKIAQPATGKPLTNNIDAQGVYRGAKFTARVATSAVLTFRETGEFFALRGHAIAGTTRLELDGQAADMFARPQLESQVRLAGASLSEIHPFTLLRPARSRPYGFEAAVKRTGDEYKFTRLRGKIGETDLAGEGSHKIAGERHIWRASLRSESANALDLGSLAGIDYAPGATKTPPGRLFPQQAIKSDRLRAQDVFLNLDAKKLSSPGMTALDSLRFEATLAGGLLQVRTIDLGIAGGHAAGHLALDARAKAPHGQAVLKLSGLDLERLFPSLPGEARNTGPLRGTVNLEGTGESVAAILGSASGKLDLALDGGSLSNKVDAKLSLNLGKLAALMFKGDHAIPIYCAMAGFDFTGGIGRARALLVETEQTRIEGSGALNLREERQDLLLVPQPKNPGIFTLGSTIRVGGTFKHPSFDFHKGASAAGAAGSGAHCAGRPAAAAVRAAPEPAKRATGVLVPIQNSLESRIGSGL